MKGRLAHLGTFLAAAALAGPAAADVFGVVVGIDDYAHQSDLEGAVNDALDIAGALERRGADVIVLTDRAATRSAVVGAVRQQFAKAQAGDVVVFTYAGHGVQFEEALAGDEEDGKDETFVFAEFESNGDNAAERLRDNEVAMLMRDAPDGVSVLFVADSCHSGTMTRAPVLDAPFGKTRFLDSEPIKNDPLPPPDRDSFQLELSDMPHVVFAAASRDNEVTPEMNIDGRQRGALSWSVARVIESGLLTEGGADTLPEFREHIRAQVRAHSGARQTPNVVFASSDGKETSGVVALLSGDNSIVSTKRTDGGSGSETARPELAPGDKPTLFIVGDAGSDHEVLAQEAELTAEENEAMLAWDVENSRLVDRVSADLMAEAATAEDAAAAIRKWRAVQGLSRWAPQRAFQLSILQGDGRHLLGSKIEIDATMSESSFAEGHLTLVNLASGGEVQYLYPSDKIALENGDALSRGAGPKLLGRSTVTEPVGADHLLGIVTKDKPDELRQSLQELNSQRSPAELLEILRTHASDPRQARVAILPIHTARQ